MVSDSGILGKRGEDLAARYLMKRRYRLLERNFSIGGSEVDIIALKGDTLCFVEVKTRRDTRYGLPEEYVDRRKIARVIRAARLYSTRPSHREKRIRFDIIAVVITGDGCRIEHLKNAFEQDFY